MYNSINFNQEDKAFEVAKQLEKEIPNSEWAHVSLVKFQHHYEYLNWLNSFFELYT